MFAWVQAVRRMELNEPTIFSIIVKIWLEETATETGRATWRGHVTHVPSNERHYVQRLDEVTDIITHYLLDMGVEEDKDEEGSRSGK